VTHKLKPELIQLSPKQRLYNSINPIIGLTGGIGTGKSTATSILSQLGFSVIDADALIKKIYQKGETLDFVLEQFPEAIVEGKISFPKLRQLAFDSKEVREQLEGFLYKELPRLFQEQLPQNSNEIVFYDVPLLFEKRIDGKVDQTLLIACTPEFQKERVMKRDAVHQETLEKIIKSQWPIAKKEELSNYTIWNQGSITDLKEEIERYLSKNFIKG